MSNTALKLFCMAVLLLYPTIVLFADSESAALSDPDADVSKLDMQELSCKGLPLITTKKRLLSVPGSPERIEKKNAVMLKFKLGTLCMLFYYPEF